MGVLVQGALAPEPVEPTAQEAAPEPPTPLLTLRPDLEKTALSYTADYWLQLGERVRASLVLVGRDGTPGVVVAPGQVVSALRAADELLAERLEATAARERDRAKSGSSEDAGTVDGQGEPSAEGTGPPSELEPFSPTGVDPEHGVALFKLGNTVSATPVQRANPDAFRPGAHVAAVSLTAGNDLRITPGVLVSVEEGSGYPEQDASIGERFDVAIPFPPGTRTAAIVDLDGGLLGVAIESPSGIQVLSVGTVERIASAHSGAAAVPEH